MFGRVRASSSSSLELLEMERTSSKIIKHDALSIYEATLLKLKQGSHCNSSYDPEDSAKMDANCIMAAETPGDAPITADAGCSSDSFSNSSSISLKEQGSKNMSILYFFSKYKSPEHAQNSNGKEVMIIDYSSSSSSVTPTSSS